MRDSFIFYKSFFEAMEDMDDKTLADTVRAICSYALNDQEVDVKGWAKSVFAMAKPQIDANNKRRADGQNGGRPRKEKPVVSEECEKEKPVVSEKAKTSKPNDNVNVNDNDNEKENTLKSIKEKSSRFSPPSREELEEYKKEKGLVYLDCKRFIEFYESKGWMIGKNKMKSWKAAASGWNSREKDERQARGKPKSFSNFQGREYGDMSELSRRLIE